MVLKLYKKFIVVTIISITLIEVFSHLLQFFVELTQIQALFLELTLLILFFVYAIKRMDIFTEAYKQILTAEELFRSTFYNSAIGIAHVGLDGTWLRVNNTLANFLGYDETELRSLTFQDLTYYGNLKEDMQALQDLLDNKLSIYKTEKRYIRKDKEIVWALLTVSVSRNSEGDAEYFISMISDINEQKRLEKEREELCENERKQQQKINDYVKLIDENVITSSTDLSGRITDASEAFCLISGYSKEELIGKSHSIVRHIDMDKSIYESLWHTIQNDEIWQGELKNRAKDGSYYWVNAVISPRYDKEGVKIGYTAIRQLITARKDLEESQKNERKQQLKINDYVKFIDENVITSSTNLAGMITDASEAFCKISGYSKEELIGKSHSIVRHIDMDKSIYESLWDTIQNDEIWQGELKNRAKDGSYYWVNAVISPRYDEEGVKIGYSAIRQLITAQKDLQESKDVIVAQSRMSAIGEVLAMIAHQWRQPLNLVTVLLSSVKLKIMNQASEKEIFSKFCKLEGVVQELSNTINSFRAYFDPEAEYTALSLSEILTNSIEIMKHVIEKNDIKYFLDIDTSVASQEMSNQLTQVVLNLLTNSIESFEESSTKDKVIEISATRKNERLQITVNDNGKGIALDKLPSVFDPYFSTKSNLNGKGLGLYVVKIIVEKVLEGDIRIENRDRGIRITLSFPLK